MRHRERKIGSIIYICGNLLYFCSLRIRYEKEKDLSVAVLIDGDNASSEKMEDVMRFVSRYGAAVVRRIYGDWTKNPFPVGKMRQGIIRSGWCRLLFVLGKNTTDIALVMDAMDILHEGRVGCFCLVASDGDYTLLAQRIRESGLTVLGYGEGKTPVALVRSCTEFLLADRKEEKPFQENTPEFLFKEIWNTLTRLLNRLLTVRRR